MTVFKRLLVVLALCLGSFAALADEGVLSRIAVLRKAPAQDAAKIRSLEKGEEVDVLSATPDNGFVQVRTEDGTEGWVLAKFVHPPPPPGKLLPEAAATEARASTTISPDWKKPAPDAGAFKLDGKTCGLDGSGDKRDKGTNVRKNRVDIPASYHDVTWNAIATLEY